MFNRLNRSIYEASFKLDYFHNEGMPNWLVRFNPILAAINSKVRMFGHHKFLHYRSWFQRELGEYVTDALTDARTRRSPFWNADFLSRIAQEHTGGRKNYTLELNAVLTLEAVERLLIEGFSFEQTANPNGVQLIRCERRM